MGNDETVMNDVLVTPDITSMAPCKCLRPRTPINHEIALTEFTFFLAKYIRYLKLCKGGVGYGYQLKGTFSANLRHKSSYINKSELLFWRTNLLSCTVVLNDTNLNVFQIMQTCREQVKG